MQPIRENRAKRKLQRGEVVACVGGLFFNTANVIDFLGPLGFDAVWIETEHGPQSHCDVPETSRACDLWGMTSVVRVNSHDYGLIYRTLDLGAQCVVVPHVNTADEAQAVVEAAKFHPLGRRGMYPSRQGYGFPEYLKRANDETMVIVLIEDIQAVENLDDILKVDHIDVFLVAPTDLGQSMGYVDFIIPPEVRKVEEDVIRRIISAGRVAGSLVNDESVGHRIEQGVRFVFNMWTDWLNTGAKRYLETVAELSHDRRA